MSADERDRRLEEGYAKLTELARRHSGLGPKMASFDEARAWLLQKVGPITETPEEIQRRLDEFIKSNGGGDEGQSEGRRPKHG